MERKTRYTMVDKRGREIYHSDSFLGFIGTTILVHLLGIFFLMIIAGVVCGISSIFN